MTSSNDKKRVDRDLDLEHKALTSSDLHTILEVNRKAIEIQIEVEKQNEDILEYLKQSKTKLDELDKNFFRLLVGLSALGLGTLIELVKLLSNK